MQDEIIGLLNPTIDAIYAISFIALWTSARNNKAILCLACGFSLYVIAFLARTFLVGVPELIVGTGVHLLFGLGLFCVSSAYLMRVEQKPLTYFFAGVMGLSTVLLGFALWAGSFMASLVIENMSFGILYVVTAQTLMRSYAKHVLDDIIAGLVLLFGALHFFLAAFLTIFEPTITPTDFRESAYFTFAIVSVALATIMIATSAMSGFMIDLFRESSKQAQLDPLSGALVRGTFEGRADSLLSKANDEEKTLSLIVLDIDHFKQVNDIFGHQAGDEVIRALGKLVHVTVRTSDVVGRIGGEEFCVIVWNCKGEAAVGLAERIRKLFAEIEHESLNDDIRTTVSLGVAQWEPEESYGRLFARADAALYQAKRGGRNQTRFAEVEEPEIDQRNDDGYVDARAEAHVPELVQKRA